MIAFLTSNPFIEGTESLNPKNRLVDELLFNIKKRNARGLFITAAPDEHDFSVACRDSIYKGLKEIGLEFSCFHLLDGQNAEKTQELTSNSDFIVLGGGHVPTQNKFFQKIHLRKRLQNFKGVLLGISAGSMNMAENVFVHPELPGETLDPHFKGEFQGLGFSSRNILPHWHKLPYDILDGKRMLQDIILPTTSDHVFYGLPDGSYIFSNGEREEIRGESYLISNYQIRLLCPDGATLVLQVN
jgi:dipeptidase E